MSSDLADFGLYYRSVNLQRPNAYTYLLETEILSIVEYQLKCCSVANDAAPDCRMVLSSTSGMNGCAHVWELMDNTSNICSEPQTSLFDWLYCSMT